MTEQPSPPPRKIELTGWRPMVKNTLRGFATIKFPMGLTVRDLTVHVKGDNKWVGLPAKVQIDQDGAVRRSETGKILYSAVMEWSTRELGDRFGAAVIELVENHHGRLQ